MKKIEPKAQQNTALTEAGTHYALCIWTASILQQNTFSTAIKLQECKNKTKQKPNY